MHASPTAFSPQRKATGDFDVLGQVRRFWRKRGRSFLTISLLLMLLVWFAFRPKMFSASTLQGAFTSSSSLLLPGQRAFSYGGLLVNLDPGELDVSLSDSSLFQRFVQRQRILEKVERQLQSIRPSLAPLARSCSITPEELGRGTVLNQPSGEVDYAQFEQGGQQYDARKYRRFNRIRVVATASSPSDSQLLVELTVKTLQAELVKVAVAKTLREKAQVEEFIRSANRKVNKLTARLAGHAELEPENITQHESRMQLLTTERRRLSLECLSLEREIGNMAAAGPQGSEDPHKQQTRDTLHELEMKVRQMEITYAPSSPTLRLIQERVANLRAFYQRQRDKEVMRMTASLRSQLKAKRSLRDARGAELLALQAKYPSDKLRRRFVAMEHDLRTWNTELLGWEQQLLKLRLEEQLCKQQGAAVVLQPALPGTRPPILEQPFFVAYGKCLKFMPLAPLVVLSLLILLELWQNSRRFSHQARLYLDAPVLGELPTLPADYRRAWMKFKRQGSSAPGQNPKPSGNQS